MDEPTSDPSVVIEERSPGYVRYRRTTDGQRWEVNGTCDRRGDCMIGANILVGEDLISIESHEHLAQLVQELSRERLDSEMDVPVVPGFSGCCPLEITVLAE